MMDNIPRIETFLDLVATALAAITVAYSIVALFNNAKAGRLGAILLVVSLALYADSPWTYFAAIFIVATAVTELEFLEKLAAIIRGSKEYFDYKKSQVPVAEAKAKAEEEAVAAIAAETAPNELHPAKLQAADAEEDAEPAGQLLPSGEAASIGYAVEQLTLSFFERRLGQSVQRNIRFSTPRADVEFDGVVERGDGRSDTLIEVKLASPKQLEVTALSATKEFSRRRQIFREMTGRRTTGILIVVVPDKHELGEVIRVLKAKIQATSHTLQFEVVDFKDIGYSMTSS